MTMVHEESNIDEYYPGQWFLLNYGGKPHIIIVLDEAEVDGETIRSLDFYEVILVDGILHLVDAEYPSLYEGEYMELEKIVD